MLPQRKTTTFRGTELTHGETKLVRPHQNQAMAKRKQGWGQPPWKIVYPERSRMTPATKASPWPVHVDVAIVGGGFAGLTAAAYVKRGDRRKSVLVLEAGSIGNGASGRTGEMALAQSAA